MRVIEGENELRLTCSRSASGGIALLRCETQDDIVRLPDEIDGVPVTEVGAYVLSERVPDLTGKDTFAVRITCGGTEPVHDAAAIRTVQLPKDAKSVGSYAFYNCRNLERIELTDSVSEFGGGALMNCMSLREVILHAAPSAPTCLPRLLGEYAGELDVRFDEHARLLAKHARRVCAHVNLIPLNHVEERAFRPSTPEHLKAFIRILEQAGVNVTVRRKLGSDVDASCGQLRKKVADHRA